MNTLKRELSNATVQEQRDTIFASYVTFLTRMVQTGAIASVLSCWIAVWSIVSQIMQKSNNLEVSWVIAFLVILMVTIRAGKRLYNLKDIAEAVYGENVFDNNENLVDVLAEE